MLHDWGVIAAAFAYIGLLFAVASYGDRLSPSQRGRAGTPKRPSLPQGWLDSRDMGADARAELTEGEGDTSGG